MKDLVAAQVIVVWANEIGKFEVTVALAQLVVAFPNLVAVE